MRGIYNKSKVFEIEIDKYFDKLYAKDLMQKHPTNWVEKYQLISKNEMVAKMVIEELSGESWNLPTTRVLPKTESDRKLLEKLRK